MFWSFIEQGLHTDVALLHKEQFKTFLKYSTDMQCPGATSKFSQIKL